jgi:mannose-6-phosphate isomerase-like protein (cupin superfamily)
VEVHRTSVEKAEVFDEPSNAAIVRPLARAYEGPSSMSVTWVSLDGRHQRLASRRSARRYYVLSGELSFVVGGGEPEVLRGGEVLVIPKDVPYHLEGTGTYLVLNTPAFETGDDEYVEAAPGE